MPQFILSVQPGLCHTFITLFAKVDALTDLRVREEAKVRVVSLRQVLRAEEARREQAPPQILVSHRKALSLDTFQIRLAFRT